MNRRGFLRAVGAAVAWSCLRPAHAAAASDDTLEKFRDAIRRRRVVRLRYAGHERTVEPHALGHTTSGKRALLAWQIAGGSHREPPNGWRTFLLSAIERCEPTERTFSPRPDFRREKSGLRDVELDVSPAAGAPSNPPAAGRG
jgi:predicted DNA-binding transcriptional regulator YafY